MLFSPKDEQEVADYVARHLREDLRDGGIVVNREVQISRGIGDGTGQRTDVYVDAINQGKLESGYDELHMITEVIGNWNAGLSTAMETQLHDRYLKKSQCSNGLYLVARFESPKWIDSDSRKRSCPQKSLTELREQFSKQAAELSKDGDRIRSYVLDTSLS